MKCPFCKSELKSGKTVLTFQMGSNRILVVKDVPALICEQCGEESIDIETSKNVEKLVHKALSDGISMGFIEYTSAA
ncbi:MAG: type II toxin-antitoxin system MqsA family antitoxin [Calditrichaeota bacterium]|nr:type II toxin-antitoxin system MqsA family antitoxin [Calditrichota bacterium]